MSKNVAVFVDVANIFYAAKAAGVDIDYVTLLKSATAGRDLVRAYAYTGLDPENENQRQFHSFLARSGYKVVSKDIRKYGDGRIKANLDIELVVDMMRTARNLDIAVVVSGDGDFAPAIRAVQQTGVRVEVISFRGNTSSDLIEVADVFTDITQIARVEKGTSRSGRRVAAEGDLSMTEVPDKETETGQRRRRGGRGRDRDERPAPAVAAATDVRGGNLIVLPGERLSRVAPVPAADMEIDADVDLEPVVVAAGTDEEIPAAESAQEMDADGRRRRRRRGGRGRGRGRPADAEMAPAAAAASVVDDAEDEDVEELEVPRAPQHSTFGSVWDTQLGVPTASLGPTADVADDEFDDEPEIPEYLLAERRQRAQRGRGGPGQMGARGRGGRASGYQAAVDRERYGRGGGAPAGGFTPPRRDDRPRGPRPPQGGQPPRLPRPERGPRRPDELHQRPAGSEPWTEVPPELEEMLRLELARKTGGAPEGGDGARTGGGRDAIADRDDQATVLAVPDPVPGSRHPRDEDRFETGATTGGPERDVVTTVSEPAPAAAPRRGGRRPARADTDAATAPAAVAGDEATAPVAEPGGSGTRPTSRRRRTAESAEATAPVGPEAMTAAPPSEGAARDAGTAVEDAGEPAAATPVRRRMTRTRSVPEAAVDAPPSASDSSPEPAAAAPARRRATRSRATADATGGADASTPGSDAGATGSDEASTAPEPTPRRRTTRSRAASTES